MEASTNLGRVSLVPRGEYDPSSQYERLDVVGYDGSAFLALRSVQGVTPVDGADYMLIARRGSVGATGSVGPQGEQGIPGVQGPKGDKGDPGSSIAGIERTDGTGAPGTTDTYTITLTDGSTSTFQVRNGADGDGAGDMTKSVYDPQGKNTDVFAYIDEKVKDAPALENLVTVPSGGEITLPDTLGAGPYTFEFEEDGEGSAVDAAQVAYDGSASGVEAETVQGALDLLSAGKADADRVSNPNLLDNWYFADPINQRGQTEYTTDDAYTIDRWVTNGCIVSLTTTGIKLKSINTSTTFYQKCPDSFLGRVVTLSALLADNTLITHTLTVSTDLVAEHNLFAQYYDGLTFFGFIIPSNGEELEPVAIKAELGPVQTLAHKEEDTWVLNDPPPDKTLELLKCQKYQLVPATSKIIPYGSPSIFGRTEYNGILSLFVPTPVELRANPDIRGGKISIVGNHTVVQFDSVQTTGIKDSNGVYFSVPGDFSSIGVMEAVSANIADLFIDSNL